MGQFTQLYGRPALPPRFSLGLWYHPLESSNQTHVLGVVGDFAAQGVPLAAVTLEPPWQTHAYACTYVWSNSTFWDVPGFIASMRAADTEVTLWQHAYIFNESQGHASPLWDPVYGGGLASDWITWGGATPDWTLPATRAAVSAYMNATFLDAGERHGGGGGATFVGAPRPAVSLTRCRHRGVQARRVRRRRRADVVLSRQRLLPERPHGRADAQVRPRAGAGGLGAPRCTARVRLCAASSA